MLPRNTRVATILALPLMWSSISLASDDEPQVVVESDGTVQVTLPVDADPAQVRAALADPKSSLQLSDDVLDVQSTPKGSCDALRIETRGLTRPLVVHTERCRTSSGVRESLVKSDDFTAYASEWRVTERDGRTVVTLRTKAEPNMSVPRFLVLRSIRDGAVRSVLALKRLITRSKD